MDGLLVEVKMLGANGSEIQTGTMFFGPGVIGNGAEVEPFDGTLNAGEVRTLRGLIGTDWRTLDDAMALGTITTIAEIKLGDVFWMS